MEGFVLKIDSSSICPPSHKYWDIVLNLCLQYMAMNVLALVSLKYILTLTDVSQIDIPVWAL